MPPDDLTLGEPAAVAHTPHGVLDGVGRIARGEKMCVERMAMSIAGDSIRRDQTLGEELAAEQSRARALDAAALVPVVVERREIERFEQRGERSPHRAARPLYGRSQAWRHDDRFRNAIGLLSPRHRAPAPPI